MSRYRGSRFFRPRRHRLTELEQTETRTARKMAALLLRLGLIEEGEKVRVVRCRPGHWQIKAKVVTVYLDRHGDRHLDVGKEGDEIFTEGC